MSGLLKTLQSAAFFLLCLHHTAVSQLQVELTTSYHTLIFSWPDSVSNCSSSYELSCTTPSVQPVFVGEFTPLSNGTQCEYRQFGFLDSTTYACSVTPTFSSSPVIQATLTTLGRSPSIPQSVSVYNITQHSFVVTWDPPQVTNDLREYAVYFYRDSEPQMLQARVPAARTSFEATGLSAGTGYQVQVQAVSGVEGNLAVSTSFQTLFEVPRPPTANSLLISENSRTQQGLSITWAHRPSTSNAPLGFNITYTPLNTLPESDTAVERQVTVQDPGERLHTFTDLMPNQSYRVTVAAYNSAGTSSRVAVDAPPFITEPSSEVLNNRSPYLQLRFTGANSCSDWMQQFGAGSIAEKLFERLNIICPNCSYTPWSAHIRAESIACSNTPDELVFRAQIVFCDGNLRRCNLITHIEFFHSVAPSFLLFPNDRILILDRNCPLYSGSAQSMECLTGGSSSIGAIVGGVIGGFIAGTVISLGIAAIVIAIVTKCRKKDEDMEPHPKTNKFPGTSSTTTAEPYYTQQHNQSDDPGYEFLPVFNKGSEVKDDPDAEYDVPQLALTGLPSAHAVVNSEYEVMDPVEEKTLGAGRGGKGDSSKRQKAPALSKQKLPKPTFINEDKTVDKGPSKAPLAPGGKKKVSASNTGERATQSTANLKRKYQTEGQQGAVGKGSPPQHGAVGQPEEVGGFRAMREKLAANMGGATVEGQSAAQQQDGRKKPLLPTNSNLPAADFAAKKAADPKPGGSGQWRGQETVDAIPAVLPKPQKKPISTVSNNRRGHQNLYQT